MIVHVRTLIAATAALLLLTLSASGAARARDESFTMFAGEVKIMRTGAVERVTVGNGALLSHTILKNGQLILLAEKEGNTDLHIWRGDGKELHYQVEITKEDTRKISSTVHKLLADIPGLGVREVNGTTVLEGEIMPEYQELVEMITKQYGTILNLARKAPTNAVAELLAGVPGVKVRTVGGATVLEGIVAKEYQPMVEAVSKQYNLLDLTRKSEMLDDAPMVYMDVKFTEFNTSKTRNLGIQWDTSVTGPAAGYVTGYSTPRGGKTMANSFQGGPFNVASTSTLTAVSGLDDTAKYLRSPLGFFGIATAITSRINLLVSNGDALVLAQPRLSARSGGSAEFLAGGEIPIQITSADGVGIEYKKFGISLNISPTVDGDNIQANVETEVSSVDQSLAVNNTPGFRSRRAKADVSLKSGQTLVISGLVNREVAEDVTKMPWLGDLPVLGKLFRSTNFRNNKSELVVFVTPTVYDADSELNRGQVEKSNELTQRFMKSIGKDLILD